MSWFVYILKCSDNSLYTGVTTDIQRRVEEHNHSSKGAKCTRARRPVKLVYSEKIRNRSKAQKREWELKKLSAKEKQLLVSKL